VSYGTLSDSPSSAFLTVALFLVGSSAGLAFQRAADAERHERLVGASTDAILSFRGTGLIVED
ncbi:MAG: hypothetical protein GY953_24285, partial [bacterium]|nr:hypothetical protein [bacterium]